MADRKISAEEAIRLIGNRRYKWAQVHHTWKPDHSSFNGSNHLRLQQNMRNYHVNSNGWSDIGQHLTLFPDGTFVTGRNFDRTPAGIKGYNSNAFMIEMMGNFDKGHDKLEGEQLRSALAVYQHLVNNGATILFHREKAAKSCPGTGIDKAWFVRAVKNFKGSTVNVSSSNPRPTQSSGESIVDYMNRQNMDSSFSNRKKLAQQHGITNYKGTASQNIELLNKLKNPPKVGWIKNNTGWWYRNANGSYPKGEWKCINKQWYLFDNNGYMLTGWQKSKDKWYYMNKHGHMQKGWIKLGKHWYYLNASGAMQTGWVKLKDVWYYLNSNGSMATGWRKVNNRWYYMNNSGAMQTGLITIDGKHYYLERSGALITDESVELEANKHGHLK